MMNLQGQSSDSLTISKRAARNLYTKALQKDACDSLLVIANVRIVSLRTDFNQLVSKDSAIIANYDKQVQVLEDEKKVLLDAIASKNKDLRRERRKRTLITIAGVVATGAAIIAPMMK